MRAIHVAGLTALLLWQIAPVPGREASRRGGLTRLGLAWAAGDWENASFDCSGRLTDSWSVRTRSAGAKLEYLSPAGTLRLTAAGGRWWMGGASVYPEPPVVRTFVGAQVGFEGHSAGLGLGVLDNPVRDGVAGLAASASVRFGNADKAHFRLDVNPLSETPGMMGTVRMGVGFGQGLVRLANGFVGLAFGPFAEEGQQTVLVGDLGIPVAATLDLLLRGNAGPGAGKAQWAAGVGLRAVW